MELGWPERSRSVWSNFVSNCFAEFSGGCDGRQPRRGPSDVENCTGSGASGSFGAFWQPGLLHGTFESGNVGCSDCRDESVSRIGKT